MNESQMRNLTPDEWLRQEPETPREKMLIAVIRRLLEDECSSYDAYEEDFLVLREENHQLLEETESLRATIGKVREVLMEHEV